MLRMDFNLIQSFDSVFISMALSTEGSDNCVTMKPCQ